MLDNEKITFFEVYLDSFVIFCIDFENEQFDIKITIAVSSGKGVIFQI